MSLFKKTTSLLVLASLVSSIFSVGASAYSSADLEAANALAAKGIIVAKSDAASYSLDQNVLRQEIAAVARGVAGLEKVTTSAKIFTDVTATKPNTWAFSSIEALANAGIIAKNTTFRPEAKISKAEAVGMLVKAAYGSTYAYDASKGTSWQEQVVEFAVSKGLVTSFTNYDTAATRGFVFGVGAKAIGSQDTSSENDLLGSLLGGLTGTTTSTGTTTTGTTVSTSTGTTGNGTLTVSLSPTSAKDGTQIPKSGTVLFGKVDFTAGNADVAINTVDLAKVGLATIDSSVRVWFEKNGTRLSGKAAFSSDGTAVISFAPAYSVKAGSTETLDLYVSLNISTSGTDIKFSGKVSSSTAITNNGSFSTSALRTADYTVAPVTFQVLGSTGSYTKTSDFVELGRFSLFNADQTAETRDVAFQTITLRQNGNGDLIDLSDIQVQRNGVKVSTTAAVSGKDVVFTLNDTVKDGATATYYIYAKVSNVQNNSGDTYQFSLRNTTDLTAIEILNGFKSTVSTSGPSTFVTYTITGGDLVLERDSSVALSKNISKGTSNVTLLKGKITSKSAVTLEDLSLDYAVSTSTGAQAANTSANQAFDTVYVKIGSSTMTWTAGSSGKAVFNGLATVNGTVDIEIYAKLKDTATATSFKFADIQLSSFTKAEYVSNQNTISSSVGSISAVTINPVATTLSVTRSDGLGNTKIAAGSKSVILNGVNLSVTQGNSVSISNARYDITYSGSAVNNMFATLYVDGVAISTKTFVNANPTLVSAGVYTGTINFTGLNKLVPSTPAVSLVVKADFSDAYSGGTLSAKLISLDAVDSLTSAKVDVSSVPSSADLTVATASGIVSSSDSNPKSTLLLAGAKDQKILAFRIQAKNDTIKVSKLSFTGVNLTNLSNFRVLTPTGNYLPATSNSGTAVVFDSLSPSDAVAADKTDTYYLVADVNTNVNGVAFSGAFDTANSKFKSSNGNEFALYGSGVYSNNHLINENLAVVAKAANSSKLITTSALKFTVTASGKDQITLSGAYFNNLLSGYTGTTVTINVYKNSVTSSNLLGSTTTTANGGTGTVVFTNPNGGTNNTVDAGSTNTYVVTVEGITNDSTKTSQDWSVSLTNVEVGSIKAGSYDNMGVFPITETK